MSFWSFKNIVNDAGDEEIELRIEGEIIDDDYAWLYEWFGISAASPNSFKEELKAYKGQNITVWIDSYGGSVFAAAGMYNALMEHKKSGAKVKCKVDGKAMSAATIPMMAGDERLMSPVAIFMMHNPLTEVYGYASDLRKAADVLDEVKETIVNAYQLGTNRSRAKISQMMDDETYLSARSAVKEGFATAMLYSDQNEPPIDDAMNLCFGKVIAVQNAANVEVKKFFELQNVIGAPQVGAKTPQPDANKLKNKQEGNEPMFKNVEELRNAHPELVKQIEDAARTEGAKEERNRIQDIEKISNNVAPDLVNKAKYTEPMDAKELAFQAMQLDNGLAQKHLENLKTETAGSGANRVTGSPQNQQSETAKKEETDKAVNNIAAGANSRRGK